LPGVRAAADRLHIRLSIEHVTNQQEIEKTFASLSQLGAGAVFVLADPLFNDRSDQLVELQHRYSLPTAFAPEFGGLMGYSANVTSVFHDLGTYTGRVL
jgi:hypothetical protein